MSKLRDEVAMRLSKMSFHDLTAMGQYMAAQQSLFADKEYYEAAEKCTEMVMRINEEVTSRIVSIDPAFLFLVNPEKFQEMEGVAFNNEAEKNNFVDRRLRIADDEEEMLLISFLVKRHLENKKQLEERRTVIELNNHYKQRVCGSVFVVEIKGFDFKVIYASSSYLTRIKKSGEDYMALEVFPFLVRDNKIEKELVPGEVIELK